MNEKPREVFGDIHSRYEWKKVQAPHTWKPSAIGEELAGFYGGKTIRTGRYGQYEVALVHIPRRGTFMVTGTRALQLIDAANINVGWPIRIVWQGRKDCGTTDDGEVKQMKLVDVYVAEGDPISADCLPLVKT